MKTSIALVPFNERVPHSANDMATIRAHLILGAQRRATTPNARSAREILKSGFFAPLLR